MKKKLVLLAMLVVMLALGLSLIGCPTDGGGDGGGDNKNAELVGTWKGGIQTLTITETTFKMAIGSMQGPFTYNGTTLTYQDRPSFTVKVTKTNATTMVISDYSSTDEASLKEYLEGTYTKQ
jgi:hypothetical protein